MEYNYKKMVNVSIHNMKSCLFIIKAQTVNAIKRSPDPSYVILGDTLTVNVIYTDSGAAESRVGGSWKNSSARLLYGRGRLVGVDDPDSRASLLGQATLVLKITELYDNGTYRAHWLTA